MSSHLASGMRVIVFFLIFFVSSSFHVSIVAFLRLFFSRNSINPSISLCPAFLVSKHTLITLVMFVPFIVTKSTSFLFAQ